MKQCTPSFKTGIAIFFMMLFLICKPYENNNPYDPIYPSSKYTCRVAWNMLPETCYINTQYEVACTTSEGSDTFDHFLGYSESENSGLDIQIAPLSYNLFKIAFNKEYHGKVIIAGVRPNCQAIYDTGSLTIIDQYKPRITSFDTLQLFGNEIQGN
jgi:hypothetical protein